MKKNILAILWVAGVLGVRSAGAEEAVATGDYVVIVHGMGRTHRSMGRIAGALRKAGYRPVNFGYLSFRDCF